MDDQNYEEPPDPAVEAFIQALNGKEDQRIIRKERCVRNFRSRFTRPEQTVDTDAAATIQDNDSEEKLLEQLLTHNQLKDSPGGI